MKVAIVLGTRPEIIKLAPIIKQLNKKSASVNDRKTMFFSTS